jgi:hypothetical protein
MYLTIFTKVIYIFISFYQYIKMILTLQFVSEIIKQYTISTTLNIFSFISNDQIAGVFYFKIYVF